MDKFLIKRPRFPSSTNTHVLNLNSAADSNAFIPDTNTPTQKRANIEFNPDSIISDPGARIPIDEYDVNIRDQVRRAYIAKGPFRPVDYTFPKNGDSRTFQANWFGEFDWLEYSIHKDAAFCMWCYLFNPKRADNSGKNAFTTTGFKKWKKALNKFRSHIGLVGSSHNGRGMKIKLQLLREEKWETFLEDVKKFCVDNLIEIPNMEDILPIRGRSRREGQAVTYFHIYRVEIFCGVIDLILQEMDNRFTEGNTELLLCIGSLDPRNSFSGFDRSKLIRLALFYPEDFSLVDLELLPDQLDNFIYDVRNDEGLSKLQNIGDLAVMMVRTHRHTAYPLVYQLVELALVLPVATATVERVFSAMKILKTYQRNRIGDEWLNDSMMVYIEKTVFAKVDNEAVLQNYQNMQSRRIQLSSITSSTKNSSSVGN